MEGIDWFELFNAMDKFLIGIVERNVVMFYLVLFAIFFSETGLVFMTFLPGDSLLFVAGAVSALPQAQVQGLNVYLLMPIIIAGAILGNTLNYQIGAWLGHKVYDGSIKWIDKSALDKTHAFYERHGGKTVMIARFVPVVRSFAPLVAGASGMDYKKFQLYNVLGAVIVMFAGTMLVPLAVAHVGGDAALPAYDNAILITFGAGVALFVATRRYRRDLLPRDGFLLVALVWTVLPAFATLPLLLHLEEMSFTDAYFETMSGLTTTGSTVMSGLDHLPLSINVWRHLLVWIGGMGILVLAVAILPLLGRRA